MKRLTTVYQDYNVPMNSSPAAAFHTLSPDTVLDALESIGLFSDGRLLALNSYENRVYQVGIEDAAPIVVKFYRPARWSDAAIHEEHQFVDALHAQEIPVVPPQQINGVSLHHHQNHRFAVFARQGGRAPALDQAGTLTWIGRFLGRIHAVGATQPFVERPKLDQHSFGIHARQWLLQSGLIPPELLESWSVISQQALDAVQRCYQRAGDVRLRRLHGDCHIGNLLWTDAGPHFVDFDDSRTGPGHTNIKPTRLAWGRGRRSNVKTCDDCTLAVFSVCHHGRGLVFLGI